jgi:hypothetical protein
MMAVGAVTTHEGGGYTTLPLARRHAGQLVHSLSE